MRPMKDLLSFMTFSKENYYKVREEVWKENWRAFHFFSGVAALAFVLMLLASALFDSVGEHSVMYLLYGLGGAVFYAMSFLKLEDKIWVKECLVLFFFMVLLSYGIIMGTVIAPEEVTVSYIVLMIATPVLFAMRAVWVNCIVLFSMILYIILAYMTQSEAIFHANLLDVIPYGILSMVITSVIMRSKLQRFLYQIENISLEKSEKKTKEKITEYETFITDMLRYTSSEENPEMVLNQLLEYIGEKLNSDRAYIFEDNHDGTYDNTYEWCREGVTKEIDNLKRVKYKGVLDVWFKQYKKSHNILIYDIEEYRKVSEPLYQLLKPQNIHTLVTGPIVIEGKTIGFYGVDNPPKEIMKDISNLIGMMESVVALMMRLRDNANNLEYGATHDQLTCCKNREALRWLYEGKYHPEQSLAVLMGDLNGLKEVNDKQGHDAGDKFIRRTAEILQSIFGAGNVYRMGGDEFVAILVNVTRQEFEEKVELAQIQLGTTTSIGTSYREKMDTDFDQVLKVADREMYKQKNEYHKNFKR